MYGKLYGVSSSLSRPQKKLHAVTLPEAFGLNLKDPSIKTY
jgi:hypothetical protein